MRLPATIHETLQLPDVKFFPNVNSFLKVLSALPALRFDHDGEAEPASQRLRAYLDATPAAQRNRSMAVLYINAHVKHDLDVMVDQYCRLYPEDEAGEAEPEPEPEPAGEAAHTNAT